MALSCELCGHTEFLKQDGVFVCQGCGTKYTLEEARKLMGNTSSVPATTSTATAQTAEVCNVKSQNDSTIEKYLILAQNAYQIRNFSESLLYANKILELDPTHSRAWFLKASSLCWSTNIQQGITLEIMNCYANAENNVADADHDALKNEMGNDMWQVSYGLLVTACNYFRQSPGDYRDNVIWLYDHILKIAVGFVEVCLGEDQSKEFIKDITGLVWQVAVDVYNSVRNDRFDPHNYFSYYTIFAFSCLTLLERCAEVTELPAESRWKLYNNVECICVDFINDYPPGHFDAMENGTEIFLRGYYESLEKARYQMSALKSKSTKKKSSSKAKTQNDTDVQNGSTETKTPKKPKEKKEPKEPKKPKEPQKPKEPKTPKEPQKPIEPETIYWEDVYVTDNPYEIPRNFEFYESITKSSIWSGIATDYGVKRAVEKIQKAAASKGYILALITEIDCSFGVSVTAELYKEGK